MIRYDLTCENDHAFEGWFPGSDACDTQIAKGLLECPICASRKVRKALMAPAVSAKKGDAEQDFKQQAMAFAATQAKLAAMRAHVEENFENVGDEFAEEARRIHYGETEKRDIYGEATLPQVKELVDEGVEIAPLPTPARSDA
jgi:hypothetical protein